MSYELHMKMGTDISVVALERCPTLIEISEQYKNSNLILYKKIKTSGSNNFILELMTRIEVA